MSGLLKECWNWDRRLGGLAVRPGSLRRRAALEGGERGLVEHDPQRGDLAAGDRGAGGGVVAGHRDGGDVVHQQRGLVVTERGDQRGAGDHRKEALLEVAEGLASFEVDSRRVADDVVGDGAHVLVDVVVVPRVVPGQGDLKRGTARCSHSRSFRRLPRSRAAQAWTPAVPQAGRLRAASSWQPVYLHLDPAICHLLSYTSGIFGAMMKSDRLLSIMLLLQTHGQLPASDLAGRLEVSVRTVMRDIEALSAAGVPVYTVRGPYGGIALLPGYRTNVTGLTAQEARALFVLLSGSAHADLGLGQAIGSALRKLMAALPAPYRPVADLASRRILIDPARWRGGPARPTGVDLAVLQQAVFTDRRLRLRYQHGRNNQVRSYTLDPYGLVNKAGVWYLVADH